MESVGKKGTFAVCVMLALVALAIAWKPLSRYRLRRAFAESDLLRFEELIDECRYPLVHGSDMPYRRGKVLLLRPSVWQLYRRGARFATQIPPEERDKRMSRIDPPRLDDSWHRLDPAIRASSTAEVETVIFIEYGSALTGIYVPVGGPNRFHEPRENDVVLRIYDAARRKYIGSTLVRCGDPESPPGAPDGDPGEPPDIARFVAEKLPVR